MSCLKHVSLLFLCASSTLFGRPATPLFRAARFGDEKRVRHEIEKGTTIDARTRDGHTPLMLAVREGHVKATRELVKQGANPNATTYSNNNTPLMIAAQHNDENHKRIVKILKDHHAHLGLKNVKGKTAHDIALEKKHTDMAKLLRPKS